MTPAQGNQTQPESFRSLRSKARAVSDDISELLDLYYKLGVVTVSEKAANAASFTITSILILFLIMFTLFFAGLGLGWYLGEKTGSFFLGYTIIALIFASIIAGVLLIRKKILFPFIRNSIVRKIYE